jgi:hypothetical protein
MTGIRWKQARLFPKALLVNKSMRIFLDPIIVVIRVHTSEGPQRIRTRVLFLKPGDLQKPTAHEAKMCQIFTRLQNHRVGADRNILGDFIGGALKRELRIVKLTAQLAVF